jgi:hypothetical protein
MAISGSVRRRPVQCLHLGVDAPHQLVGANRRADAGPGCRLPLSGLRLLGNPFRRDDIGAGDRGEVEPPGSRPVRQVVSARRGQAESGQPATWGRARGDFIGRTEVIARSRRAGATSEVGCCLTATNVRHLAVRAGQVGAASAPALPVRSRRGADPRAGDW